MRGIERVEGDGGRGGSVSVVALSRVLTRFARGGPGGLIENQP